MGVQVRVRILQRIADSLQASTDEILEANAADVAAMAGRIDQQLMQRLQLKPAKLQSLINSACSAQVQTGVPHIRVWLHRVLHGALLSCHSEMTV